MEDAGSESDYSDSSGSESSTSTSSSESSDDLTELARIAKQTLRLPKGLCDNAAIFKEFFSIETWKILPDNFQAYLKNKFLPHFPENNAAEQERTLHMLFNGEIMRFKTSPLVTLQRNLEEGSYRPDVLRLRESISSAKRREQRFQESERISRLSKALMISRERLLRAVYDAPPGAIPKVDRLINSVPQLTTNGVTVRAKKRFYEEISILSGKCGVNNISDEESEDIDIVSMKSLPVPQIVPNNETKIFGTMCSRNQVHSSLPSSGPTMTLNDDTFKEIVLLHKKRKLEEPDRPEFDTSDIRLRDVHARAQIASGYRKMGPGRPLGRKSLLKKQKDQPDGLSLPTVLDNAGNSIHRTQQIPMLNAFGENNFAPNQPPSNENSNSESDDDISVNVDSNMSAHHPVPNDDGGGKKRPAIQGQKIGKKIMFNINGSTLPEDIPRMTKELQEQQQSSLALPQYHGKIKAATLSDLEGIDMMHLPVDLDDSGHIDLLNDLKSESSEAAAPELMQETHACFLSLMRDIFCSTPNHRMKMEDLKGKICAWLSNPITALNDWYCQADNWLSLIPSAIHFLAGEFLDQPEDFVPYIEYKQHMNIYQWIGAGRDSDQHLIQLCGYWLARRNDMGNKPTQKFDLGQPKSAEYDDSLLDERPISPPPPRCPTNWTVQSATTEEIEEFRIQERQRFENPHKAFTYRQHGYDSVVGPVKGIYTQILALTKARGHTMLNSNRPNFVTILILVRDATARLPNGEGTRADICELLKSSQYINPEAQDSVLQTIVSGALDRMHTEHDPCVRYDAKRKIWIYLHRNRSEEEFERLHQQFQGVGKHKKITTRKVKQKSPKTIQSGLLSNEGSPIQQTMVTSPQGHVLAVPKSIPNLSAIQGATIINTTGNPAPIKVTAQKLNPIIAANLSDKGDSVDIETSLDSPNTIILQPKSHQSIQNIQTVVVDSKIQKFITKKALTSPTSTSGNTTQVKVSTASGIQTVHVSTAIPVQGISSDVKQTLSVQSAAGQATLISNPAQNNIQNQIVVGGKKITKPILINQNQTSIVQQVGHSGQGYIIPVNINNADQLKGISSMSPALISTSNLSPKLVKSNQHPVLSTTVNNRPTLLQQAGKSFVRVTSATSPIGKSLINPHVAATNISLQQHQKLIGNSNTSNIQLTQKIGTNPIVVNSMRPQMQKATGVSLINNLKGQQTLASVQSKQILQNIITQQQKQRINTVNMGPNTIVVPSSALTGQNTAGIQTKNVIIPSPQGNVQQIQKIVNVSSAGLNTVSVTVVGTGSTSTATNTATVITNPQPGTSLINPQIIQIQGTGTKVQTLNTANLTPQQQQSLLQSIKQQQLKLQQAQVGNPQSLIIKQQPIFQQIQKQQSGTPNTISVSVGTGSPKTVTSMMGTNLITASSSITGANVIQHQAQNIVKHQTIVQQSPVGKHINLTGAQQQTITRVIKSGGTSIVQPQVLSTGAGVRTQGGNPVMAKVLTNSSGQLISIEGLLQKQGLAPGTTLRVAGTKSAQTNLIQLTGSPGSQITQYAVVSQGRNLISVGTPQRMITTQASNTNTIVTSLGKVGDQKATLTGMNSPSMQAQLQTQLQTQSKVIATNQIQPLTAQQIVNAKVLGKAGTAGIRMVNASNLNIAHIRGKPVIIASKPANVGSQQTGQNVILQNPGNSTNLVIGGQTLKVQGNVMSPTNVQVLNQSTSSQPQTVMLGNQILKVQQAPATIRSQSSSATNILGNSLSSVTNNPNANLTSSASTNAGTMVVNSNTINQNAPKTVVLSSTGQAIRVQSPAQVQVQTGSGSGSNQSVILGTTIKGTQVKAGTGQQRVVLAVQGGGQILLPHGFQGGAINLKSLQGLKVVSIAQQQQQQQQQPQTQQHAQNKGQTEEQRPVFAQIFTAQQAPRPPNPGGEQ